MAQVSSQNSVAALLPSLASNQKYFYIKTTEKKLLPGKIGINVPLPFWIR